MSPSWTRPTFAISDEMDSAGPGRFLPVFSTAGGSRKEWFEALGCEAFYQAVERIERAKLNHHLAHVVDAAIALDAFFNPNVHLRGQRIRELFFQTLEVA